MVDCFHMAPIPTTPCCLHHKHYAGIFGGVFDDATSAMNHYLPGSMPAALVGVSMHIGRPLGCARKDHLAVQGACDHALQAAMAAAG